MKRFARIRHALAALLLTLVCGPLHALGLGEMVLESGLNEPLRARIPLLKTGDLSGAELLVALASEQDFAARKMEREHFYTSIRFTVDMKHPAGPCVLLSTSKPVKEPVMDLLIEVSWPGGQLLRAYTLLLDKPDT